MGLKYLNNINFLYLLIGLIIGLTYGYFTKSTYKVIKYNKLEGDLIYEDKDNNGNKCYKYVASEIRCPNSNEVLEHPTTYG
jgi:hypothetical protein